MMPIIMLSARTDAVDKVISLEVGADDYLTKPFDPQELLARVRAQMRRSEEYQGSTTESGQVSFGPVIVDYDSRDAIIGGNRAKLTAKEFGLLSLLTRNPGRVLTRDTLFERVWGYEMELGSNSLDVYIYRLRKKLQGAGSDCIETVRGLGVRFVPPENS